MRFRGLAARGCLTVLGVKHNSKHGTTFNRTQYIDYSQACHVSILMSTVAQSPQQLCSRAPTKRLNLRGCKNTRVRSVVFRGTSAKLQAGST